MQWYLYGLISLIASVVIYKLYKEEGIELRFVILSAFSWYYFIVPFLIHLLEAGGETNSIYYLTIISASGTGLAWSLFRAIVSFGLLFFILSYKIQSKKFFPSTDLTLSPIENEKIVSIFGIGMLIIGGTSLIMLFMELGGIGNAISTGSRIRTYLDKTEYLSPAGSMFKTMSAMIKGATYCMLTSFLLKKNFRNLGLFIISFTLTVGYLLFDSGRSGVVFVMCIMIFGYCRLKNKRIIIPLIALALFVFLFADAIEYLVDSTRGVSFDGFIGSIFGKRAFLRSFLLEFTFPFSNILSVDSMNGIYGYRFFYDYISWVSVLLPQRLLNMLGLEIREVSTITAQVSEYYLELGNGGGTPVDFLTLGIRQVPILGILFNVILYSIVGRLLIWMSKLLDKRYSFLLWFMYIFMFDMMISNDLGAMVKVKIGEILVFIMLLWITSRSCNANSVDRRC